MDLCLKYISYDPNYNYDDEDEELNDENSMEQDGNDTDEK
jgi:cullin-associated NEDD8-dissociated protein 1